MSIFTILLKDSWTVMGIPRPVGRNLCIHYDDVIMGKSPASQLFTQPFIRAQIKVNIKVPRHWPLWVPGEFPAQMASNAETVSIWWRHHGEWIQILKQNKKRNTLTHTNQNADLTEYMRSFMHEEDVSYFSSFNPLRAKFFRGNINIYLHFVITPHWYDTGT